MRIVIVEDEKRARRGLHNLITSISDDCEIVAEAADGKKGLEVILSVKPDAVFTDIRMPYMDGMELVKAVSDLGISSKFVIISAYEEFEIARQAISLGVTEYLVKPVTYEEVEQTLNRLREQKQKRIFPEEQSNREKYPQAHPLIIKTLGIIDKRYFTRICQEDLAQELGMTQEYFSYLFHKDVGQTFSKYLKNYRVEIAKSILLNGEAGKEDIAYQVGFSDTKYFNKVFREVTGKTVVQFLKEY
jgi:Response regulator containing CheY-like receiver domain and AraC-type DNA-binding domain